MGELVHLGFVGHRCLKDPESSHGAAGQVVGVQGVGVHPDVGDVVGPAGMDPRLFDDEGPQGQISAGVAVNIPIQECEASVGSDPGADGRVRADGVVGKLRQLETPRIATSPRED